MSRNKSSRRGKRKRSRHKTGHKTLPRFTWRSIARVLKRAGAWISPTMYRVQIWTLGGRYFYIPTDKMGRYAPRAFCKDVFKFIAWFKEEEKKDHNNFLSDLHQPA